MILFTDSALLGKIVQADFPFRVSIFEVRIRYGSRADRLVPLLLHPHDMSISSHHSKSVDQKLFLRLETGLWIPIQQADSVTSLRYNDGTVP